MGRIVDGSNVEFDNDELKYIAPVSDRRIANPNQNMTWGDRRVTPLSLDEMILMAQRKGRFRRQE